MLARLAAPTHLIPLRLPPHLTSPRCGSSLVLASARALKLYTFFGVSGGGRVPECAIRKYDTEPIMPRSTWARTRARPPVPEVLYYGQARMHARLYCHRVCVCTIGY